MEDILLPSLPFHLAQYMGVWIKASLTGWIKIESVYIVSKKSAKKIQCPLHYRSVEPYWTCMIHVANNDKFDVKICTPRCHKQDIYCTVCIIKASRKMNQKIPCVVRRAYRFEELLRFFSVCSSELLPVNLVWFRYVLFQLSSRENWILNIAYREIQRGKSFALSPLEKLISP